MIGVGTTTRAQSKWGEDSVKCHENLYIYYELAKNKNYTDAFDSWKYVFNNCPASSKNNVIFGPYIVEAKVKATTDAAKKEEYKKLLMQVYDKRVELYPEDEAYVLERKGLDMLQHYPDSTQKTYNTFKRALELSNEHSAAFYNAYFIAAARLFNDDVFEIKDVFQAYNVVQEGLEYNNNVLNRQIKQLKDKEESGTITDKEKTELEKAERELERFDDVASNNEKVLGPIATCEKLSLIYNKEAFEANKTDAVWLRRASKMLAKERKNDEGEYEDCTDNPIFFSVADALYQLEPSASAARSMAIMQYKNGNYSKAADYFKEAANQEVDPKKSSADYLRIAASYQKTGRLSDAKNAALKAASLRKGWGDPYILIAGLYAQADGSCGSNVFEKKAVYWAAIDKLQYARSIDPEVSGKANRLIGVYKQQLPDKSISFQLNHTEGEKYTIGCWIGETVTADWGI
ncbi:MAG TPA: hypothetical protein DIU20_07190 [Cryomorphaceae bacterium]|nr:hypothetical protein [Owenweeksia sp.]HCQ16026.1 hypothetical protein [Cryomorphaceae bacterium]